LQQPFCTAFKNFIFFYILLSLVQFFIYITSLTLRSTEQSTKMGFLGKKTKEGASDKSAMEPRKYNYEQFLATGGQQPSPAAVNTASMYSQRTASSAIRQAELESSKKGSFSVSSNKRRRKSKMCSPGRIYMHLLTALQIAVAVGVIVVVATGLSKTEEIPVAEGQPPVSTSVCLATTRSANLCTYAYWAAGISILVSLLISVMNMCCPRRKNAFCLSIEALLALAGALWWTAAGISEVIFGQEADDANLAGGTYRTVLWILCFVDAALFALSFFTSAIGCCAACCGMVDDDFEDEGQP
jgi:hypothetical protein